MMARWQSGHAADCNSVYAGSIPTRASIFTIACPRQFIGPIRPGDEIGRRRTGRTSVAIAGSKGVTDVQDARSVARGRTPVATIGTSPQDWQVGGPSPTLKNIPLFARVMELVDIGDLKSPDRKIVPVQVRSRAPLLPIAHTNKVYYVDPM
jgi:hypothetical protein